MSSSRLDSPKEAYRINQEKYTDDDPDASATRPLLPQSSSSLNLPDSTPSGSRTPAPPYAEDGINNGKDRAQTVAISIPDIYDNRGRLLPEQSKKEYGWMTMLFGILGLFGAGYLISFFVVAGTRYGHPIEVNVILMISDGFGPAGETMARSFVQFLHNQRNASPESVNASAWQWAFDTEDGFLGRDIDGMLPLDEILVGSSRTRSSNSLVTDSAAGATAFSCTVKTYNGAIAVTPTDFSPCGTILEAARHLHYHTGLVATSRITHATPASFYAHVVDRDMENEIATFLAGQGPLGPQVDVAFGGGLCHFLPGSKDESCRQDDNDLIEAITKYGGQVITDFESFDSLKVASGGTDLPVVGLFNSDHMMYELDRRRAAEEEGIREPSLKEMSLKALQILDKVSNKGFFLMIEGSRIDMAAHSNDPVGHMGDILAYQETIKAVKAYVDRQNNNGRPTVMISVSDHETGGLALARQLHQNKYPEYLWYPDAIFNATQSTYNLGVQLANERNPNENWIKSEILEKGLGIVDASQAEMDNIIKGTGNAYRNDRMLADMISRRAQLGWSTSGHSGVDVNLYAYGYQAEKFHGNVENTDIGKFIVDIMGLDLDTPTKSLQRNIKTWFKPEGGKYPSRTAELGRYIDHHDF